MTDFANPQWDASKASIDSVPILSASKRPAFTRRKVQARYLVRTIIPQWTLIANVARGVEPQPNQSNVLSLAQLFDRQLQQGRNVSFACHVEQRISDVFKRFLHARNHDISLETMETRRFNDISWFDEKPAGPHKPLPEKRLGVTPALACALLFGITMNNRNHSRLRNSVEATKLDGNGARGTLAAEANDGPSYSATATQHLKFHGVYQQDDRDKRSTGRKEYSFFVRTRLPGGTMTSDQLLCELDLCDRYGNGTLRLTDRQGVQIHGVTKQELPSVIRGINQAKVTTWGACGDVLRNMMCCPAPPKSSVQTRIRNIATLVSAAFKPTSQAYWELWLRDDGETKKVAEDQRPNEPFYGETYLPRKFKIAFSTPDDNCVDVLTHDLGFVAVVEQERLIGFNAYVGGGMGVTPARTDTFAAVAQPLAFVKPDEVLLLANAVIGIHRDFGNRTDRKLSRLRYLIASWGFDRFTEQVQRQVGGGLSAPRDLQVAGADDHLGWREHGASEYSLGIYIPNGRIQDSEDLKLKSGLRAIATRRQFGVVVTPHQNLLFTGIDGSHRCDVEAELAEFGIDTKPPVVAVRREAMACPALPTCGLAITESERILPDMLDQLEAELRRHGLQEQRVSMRITGCPNGCTRPYVAEIGIVGKAKGRYSIFLGGSRLGTRLGFLYRDDTPLDRLIHELEAVISVFNIHREHHESLGDFCHRVGREFLALKTQLPTQSKIEGS